MVHIVYTSRYIYDSDNDDEDENHDKDDDDVDNNNVDRSMMAGSYDEDTTTGHTCIQNEANDGRRNDDIDDTWSPNVEA